MVVASSRWKKIEGASDDGDPGEGTLDEGDPSEGTLDEGASDAPINGSIRRV